MNFNFIRNIKHENKVFYSFLFVHLVVWISIAMIRTVMQTDSLEGVYWGSLHDWGTPKHPPLAGWLTYLAFMPLKSDFCVYLMSQSFIIAGFIYIYKQARYFLNENQAILSVITLEGCWCYSYITGYYGFNPDVILLFILPAIAYYFYNCVTYNKKTDWLLLGIIVGIAFLNKYQTGLIILAMAIWALCFKRDIFKNKYLYMAIIIAFLIFLPHLLWLIKYDFFPLMYFEGELSDSGWLNHITAPLIFLLLQLALIAGTVLIFTITKLKFNSPFKLCKNYPKKDIYFLLLLGFIPLIVHLIMGLYAGGTMRPRWGYEFWFLTGVMLFYFFPIEITKKEFDFTVKSSYVVMLIIALAMGTLLSVEKNYRSRYPVSHIFNDMQKFWQAETSAEWKYVGGYLEWSLPLTIYGKTHPKCILDTNGHDDPWIPEDELKKSGALIINRNYNDVIEDTQKQLRYLPKDYNIEPKEYKFFVHNAFGQPREYTIYYLVVPPMK